MSYRLLTRAALYVCVLQAQEKPQYFDEPQFIAAGVEDASNRGGHGSDVLVRSSEALAKATASLSGGGAVGESAEALREAIARERGNSDLHHSLAAVEEKLGNPLEALREYQRAAELKASEQNLFDLGSELLTHRAWEQASGVFAGGVKMFPRSVRMLLGQAVAQYSRGSYDEARQCFFQAIDLNPGDPQPYLFLGQVQASRVMQNAGYVERMARFAKLHPENAQANYLYGVSLRRDPRAQGLLEKAVRIDPTLAAAWLELGVVYADLQDDENAVRCWERASLMEEAHYRLGLAYRRMGQAERAKDEMAVYEQMKKEAADAEERERTSIKQFVFKLR